MSVLYVTAFKDIGRGEWTRREMAVPAHVYLSHFINLTMNTNVDIVCFMDDATMNACTQHIWKPNHVILPYNEQTTFFATCIHHERCIMESQEYKKLVSQRIHHPEHSIPEYNIVNHNKVQFLMQAYTKYPSYETYVWIDFHQARHGDIPQQNVRYDHLPSDKVSMCVHSAFTIMQSRTPQEIVTLQCDHVQGSAFVVPRTVVPKLYQEYCLQLGMHYAYNIADDDQGIHLAIAQRLPNLYHFIPAPSFGYTIRLLQNKPFDVKNILNESDTVQEFARRIQAQWHHMFFVHDTQYTMDEFWEDYAFYLAIKRTQPTSIVCYDSTPKELLIALSSVDKDICKVYIQNADTSTSNKIQYLKQHFKHVDILGQSTYVDLVISKGVPPSHVGFKTLVSNIQVCQDVELLSTYALSYKIPCATSTMAYATVTDIGRKISQGIVKVDQNRTCDLCTIMTKERSDKGNGWHNYTIIYNELFEHMRHRPINLFEMGLGSCNPKVPSNMGVHGRPGASLFGWCEYFDHPDTICWGADIDKDINITNHPKIKTFYGDQLNQSVLATMWSSSELQDKLFDIIIDDGLHEPKANICMFQASIHKLRKGGIYIIEDILEHEVHTFADFMKSVKSCPLFEYASIVRIPNPQNTLDNIILVIQLKE